LDRGTDTGSSHASRIRDDLPAIEQFNTVLAARAKCREKLRGQPTHRRTQNDQICAPQLAIAQESRTAQNGGYPVCFSELSRP